MASKRQKDPSKTKLSLGSKKSRPEISSAPSNEDVSLEKPVNILFSDLSSEEPLDVMTPTTTPEQYYIQTLKVEITRLRKKLDDALDNNGEILRAKASHIEDKINLQKALADNETEIQNMKSQYLQNTQSLKNDLNIKSDELRACEDSLSIEKEKTSILQERIQKCESELLEKDILYKSIKEENVKYTLELNVSKDEIKVLADKLQTSEDKLNQITSSLDVLKAEKKSLQDTNIQLERKIKEFTEREDFLANDGARMANAISQHNENYDQMNQLIAQMKINMNSLKEQRDSENSRANITEQRLLEISKTAHELQHKKTEYEERITNVEKQNKVLLSELKKSQTIISEIKDGKASLASKVDQLEKDKVSLVLDQINHMKEIEQLRQGVEQSDTNFNSLKQVLEEEIKSKQALLASQSQYEREIQKLKEDKDDCLHAIEMLKKEVKDADAMSAETQEMHRSQQQQNIARIDEYAKKNTQLSEEIISLNDLIASSDARRTKEILEWDAERTDLKSQIFTCRQKISTLEDQIEETSMKYESCNAEVEELKDQIKQSISQEENKMRSLEENHQREIEKAKANMKQEFDVELNSVKQSFMRSAEEKYKEIMLAMKETNDKKLAVQASKLQELTAEIGNLKSSLNTSEISLKKEIEKGTLAAQQLRDLRKFSEDNSSKLQDRVRSLEKEKAVQISKLTAEIEDLSEQIVVLNEALRRKDQNIELFRVQLNSEKEQRFGLSQRLLELEEYQSKSKHQERVENQKIQALNDQLRNLETKYEGFKVDKEFEINRLQKRNDLLSETVARLTNITKDMTPSVPITAGSIPINSVSPRVVVPSLEVKPNTETLTVEKPKVHHSVTSAQEERRKFLRNTLSQSKLASSESPQQSDAQKYSTSPSPRAMINQQVANVINKVQDVIDKKKIKAFENEMNSATKYVDPVSGEEQITITDTVRLLREDMNTVTPKFHNESNSPQSGRSHDKSFSDRFRDNVRSSQDLEALPHPPTFPNIDIHEEY